MYRGEIWIDERRAQHARDERSRIHQHFQAIREAGRASRQASRASSPIRRRVGGSIVRIGQRVAGDGIGSPALTG
jgi:hypothetical protein